MPPGPGIHCLSFSCARLRYSSNSGGGAPGFCPQGPGPPGWMPTSIDHLSRNCVLLHFVTFAESGPESLCLEERQLVGQVSRTGPQRIPIAEQSLRFCPILCEFHELHIAVT